MNVDLNKWCGLENDEYLKTRCNKCFKCRAMIGNIYGFWGPGWDGKWELNYEPKEKTLVRKTYDVLKHTVLLGGQIATFSAIFLYLTSSK